MLALALGLLNAACDDVPDERWDIPDSTLDERPSRPAEAGPEETAHDDECGLEGRTGPFVLRWSEMDGRTPELVIERMTDTLGDPPVELVFASEDPVTAERVDYAVDADVVVGDSTRVRIPRALVADLRDSGVRIVFATLRSCTDASTCELAISDELHTEAGAWFDESTYPTHLRAKWGEARPDLFSEATVLDIVDMKGQ